MLVSGVLALVEAPEGCGVEQLFTTPGTVLLPLLEAASERRPRCYLTLNENSAVAAIDGYARAAGTPAAVAVHTSVSLFDMAGMLRNSSHDHGPVLVLVGLKKRAASSVPGLFAIRPWPWS